jgi:hypothetical protein
MRSPAGDHLLAARTTQHVDRRTLRPAVVQVAFGVIFLILSLPLHTRSEPAPATTITVLVYNYVHVSHATLAAAEREANKILRAAGAQAAWIECLDQPLAMDAKDLCQKGWTAQIPGLRFISGSNKFQDAEFGSTAIPVSLHYLLRKDRASRPPGERRRRASGFSRLRSGARTGSHPSRRPGSLRHRHHAAAMGASSDSSSSDRQLTLHSRAGDPYPGASPFACEPSTHR